MSTKNSNYRETPDGWERRPDAPDVKSPSRINWGRVQSVNNARQGVSELRQRQNERNEEYRRKHGES
jgi:hypothetical protein